MEKTAGALLGSERRAGMEQLLVACGHSPPGSLLSGPWGPLISDQLDFTPPFLAGEDHRRKVQGPGSLTVFL